MNPGPGSAKLRCPLCRGGEVKDPAFFKNFGSDKETCPLCKGEKLAGLNTSLEKLFSLFRALYHSTKWKEL